MRSTQKKKAIFIQLATYSTIGLEMGLSVAVGVGVGYYLDTWLGTAPWLLIVFLFVGVLAGFRRLYRLLKRMQRDDADGKS